MKKLILIPGLILTLLMSQVANAAFSDVDQTTDYETAITWMSDNGVIQGYPDGTFKPDQCVNRAEFLKMLYLTSKKDVESINPVQNNIFSDTSTDEWYWPYVSQAIEDATVEGYPDGTFKPAQCVNRVEAIKMAVLEFNDGDYLEYEELLLWGFEDVDRSAWYGPYAEFAFSKELVGLEHAEITSVESGKFFPGDSMSRKEVAEMLYRMKTLKDNSLDVYDELQKPNPLNFYVSPTSGVSFMMTDGWEVTSDLYYETESYTADYPTIMIQNSETEELLGINVKMMQCHGPLAVACYELAEGYTLGASGEQDISTEAQFLVNRMLLTFRVPANEVDLCTAAPTTTDIGSELYPIATEYDHLYFLGQLFTAYDCGIDRVNQLFGVEDGIYTLGATIDLKIPEAESTDIATVFQDLGFVCLSGYDYCVKWQLTEPIDVEDIILLKDYSDVIEGDDCYNCG
ncbi:S-layer homology domain-containing protein [Patescibacteria group bacterium]